jgi:hypothetical protein
LGVWSGLDHFSLGVWSGLDHFSLGVWSGLDHFSSSNFILTDFIVFCSLTIHCSLKHLKGRGRRKLFQ